MLLSCMHAIAIGSGDLIFDYPGSYGWWGGGQHYAPLNASLDSAFYSALGTRLISRIPKEDGRFGEVNCCINLLAHGEH